MEAAAVLLRLLTIVVALNLWLLWGVDGKVRANCQLSKIISLAFKESNVYGMVIMKERNEHEQTIFMNRCNTQNNKLLYLLFVGSPKSSIACLFKNGILRGSFIQINTALRFLQEKLLHLLLVSFHINIS